MHFYSHIIATILLIVLSTTNCTACCAEDTLIDDIQYVNTTEFVDTAQCVDTTEIALSPTDSVNIVSLTDSVNTVSLTDSANLTEQTALADLAVPTKPNNPADIVAEKNYRFSFKKLIVPGALIATGAIAIPFHNKLGEWGHPKPFRIDDYTQYVPVAAYLFAGFATKNNKHNIWRRMQIAATAYIIEACLVNAIKYTVREQRPNGSSHNSFPSGHTATVMTGAELCRLEYGWKIGLCAYSVALVTAGLRVYNQRHWCNDVLAGAGIGILSANAAYWLYPLERKLFARKNKKAAKSSEAFAMPVYEPDSKSVQLALYLTF